MAGIDIRMRRLFRNRQNLVISAIDHVLEYGDQPGLEDTGAAIAACRGIDALLLSRYSLLRHADQFGSLDAPGPIVRINWSSSFYYPLDYREGHTNIAVTVEQAVEAGAEAVICSLFLEDRDQATDAQNVKLFSEVVRQKEQLGIPLIGECYVAEHADLTHERLHAKVKRVSRVMAELGADMIKSFFTGERFHEVVENTPVPVFTIGAEKLPTDMDVLNKAKASADQGARGIIFGRNIFMAENPPALIKALDSVLNAGAAPADAAHQHGLE